MAKRAPAARKLGKILMPNRTKPAGPLKRARRTAKNLRAKPVRTLLKGGRKRSVNIAKVGAHRVGTAMPVRHRRTVVIRGTGGRFAGSKRA
jgi:hypothetical protein